MTNHYQLLLILLWTLIQRKIPISAVTGLGISSLVFEWNLQYHHYTKEVDSMEFYHDLCIEIDIITIRIKNLESEYKYWLKACHDSTINRAFPLDICLSRMENICNKVEEYTTLLEEKVSVRKEIERRMSEFETLESKVSYMRDVLGMTLPETFLCFNA
jgi:hypothetical protein